jgi:hypothetical protein
MGCVMAVLVAVASIPAHSNLMSPFVQEFPMSPTRYLVATGDLAEGYTFYGPFDTEDEAKQWAEANKHMFLTSWWVGQLLDSNRWE